MSNFQFRVQFRSRGGCTPKIVCDLGLIIYCLFKDTDFLTIIFHCFLTQPFRGLQKLHFKDLIKKKTSRYQKVLILPAFFQMMPADWNRLETLSNNIQASRRLSVPPRPSSAGQWCRLWSNAAGKSDLSGPQNIVLLMWLLITDVVTNVTTYVHLHPSDHFEVLTQAIFKVEMISSGSSWWTLLCKKKGFF